MQHNFELPEQATKNVYNFICHFIKRRPMLFLAYQLFAMGSAIDLIIWPWLITVFTDVLYAIESGKTHAFDVSKKIIISYLVIICISHLLSRIKAYFKANYVLPKLEYDISSNMMAQILNRTPSFFIEKNATELVSRIELLSHNCCMIVESFINTLVPNIFAVCWLSIGLFWYHWSLGVSMCIAVTLHLLILALWTKKTSNVMAVNSNSYNTLISKMSDTMYNMNSVKAFANKMHELKLVKIFFERYRNTHVKSIMFTERMNWRFTVIHVLLTGGALIFLLIDLFWKKTLSADDINYVLFAVTTSLLPAIWYFSDALPTLFVEAGFCNETLEVLCTEDNLERIGGKVVEFKTGKIEIKNIYFGYDDSDLLFEDFSLTIKDNEKVGLVGLSGSGKTSLVNIIAANFDIKSGSVEIDGHNISTLPQDVIRKNIATIPQDPMLFNRSILDNIRYGNINATFEDVVEASKVAFAHDFVLNLDNGYHTIIADRGAKLSGGQKQRIAIARAILKNAPILILDEATSALDKKTEKLIQDSLHQLMHDKTCIVIAHKLETIVKMDRILVFDKGRIVEEGTHKELLNNKDSHYSKLWNIGKETATATLIA